MRRARRHVAAEVIAARILRMWSGLPLFGVHAPQVRPRLGLLRTPRIVAAGRDARLLRLRLLWIGRLCRRIGFVLWRGRGLLRIVVSGLLRVATLCIACSLRGLRIGLVRALSLASAMQGICFLFGGRLALRRPSTICWTVGARHL